MDADANFAKAYRRSRRDFIAAVTAAGSDAISRVHPAPGPDGKPLFCDSAAFGPRDAVRALLLIAGAGETVTWMLKGGLAPPKGARLVAVHALDPFTWAWGRPGAPPDWPGKTLSAIAGEDLSRVKKLAVLDLGGFASQAALAAALPRAEILLRRVTPQEAAAAVATVIAAL